MTTPNVEQARRDVRILREIDNNKDASQPPRMGLAAERNFLACLDAYAGMVESRDYYHRKYVDARQRIEALEAVNAAARSVYEMLDDSCVHGEEAEALGQALARAEDGKE